MVDEVMKEQMEKRSSTVKIVLIGLFSFLITVVIAGTFLLITYKNVGGITNNNQTVVENKKSKSVEMGPIVPISPEIIVNLYSEDGSERYLKVNLTFEVNDNKAQEELTKRIPQVRDMLINILSSKTKEKIDQKEGKELIRREIISAINSLMNKGQVTNVFFQDFVIQ